MRIVDKRVLALIKAFLKAGIMSGDGTVRESDTGTPQGGILSPLLANIALSVLDAAFLREMGCPSDISAARCTPQTRRGHLSDRPLRRRFRDHGGRNQSARGRIMGRSRGRHSPSGAAAIGREDPSYVTWTRGSTFSGSASSGTARRERTRWPSTPTRRRRRCFRSWRRCGR